MKRIPFKCEFGHITIKEFSDYMNKPSVVVCERCKEEATAKIARYEHPYNNKKYIYKYPSKHLQEIYESEMAVRI